MCVGERGCVGARELEREGTLRLYCAYITILTFL
jgi:hypothetical protein